MITKAKNLPRVAFKFIKKMACKKSYGIAPHSLALSIIAKDLGNKYVKPEINFPKAFLEIFTESVIRDITLTGILFFLGLSSYVVVFFFDFITGTKASKEEYKKEYGKTKGYFDSDKAWSSIWKLSAVMMVSSIMLIFSISFALLEKGFLHQGGAILMIFFFFMATSFDIHSIGENQKRRFGEKPELFKALEEYFEFIGNLMLFRVKNIFGAQNVKHSDKMFKKGKDENNK